MTDASFVPRAVQIIGTTRLASEVRALLARRGFATRLHDRSEAALESFVADGADLVVLCLPADRGGRGLLTELLATDPHLKVVVAGVDDELPTATDAFEAGAFEQIADPESDMDSLFSAVGVALGSRSGDRHLGHLREREAAAASLARVIGRHASMETVVRVVRVICRRATHTSAPPSVLLIGETGTGKGLLAKTIHYNGARRSRPLVEVNCAALSPGLLESELFGHERGAFTDARSTRIGLFETAHGGTLFLDEIAAMPLELQPKLLTALEEKRIRRVGGRNTIEVDVQVIAAAQPTLRQALQQGRFRWDLFHRLNVVSVVVPPLRERGEDKLLLAQSFIEELCASYGTPTRRLTPEARRAILEYSWPGNVRELRNQIERTILLSNSATIDASDLDVRSPQPALEIETRRSGMRLKLPEDGVALEALERELIREALARCNGNVSAAARFLRLSRSAMIYRMSKHKVASKAGGSSR